MGQEMAQGVRLDAEMKNLHKENQIAVLEKTEYFT